MCPLSLAPSDGGVAVEQLQRKGHPLLPDSLVIVPHFSYARHDANEEGLQPSFVESCCHLPNNFDDLAHD